MELIYKINGMVFNPSYLHSRANFTPITVDSISTYKHSGLGVQDLSFIAVWKMSLIFGIHWNKGLLSTCYHCTAAELLNNATELWTTSHSLWATSQKKGKYLRRSPSDAVPSINHSLLSCNPCCLPVLVPPLSTTSLYWLRPLYFFGLNLKQFQLISLHRCFLACWISPVYLPYRTPNGTKTVLSNGKPFSNNFHKHFFSIPPILWNSHIF